MDLLVLPLAALAALATPPVSPGRAGSNSTAPLAQRSPGGATAISNISVRIISRPATIGHGRKPPLPNMIPRVATIAAADGSPVAAIIYDFE